MARKTHATRKTKQQTVRTLVQQEGEQEVPACVKKLTDINNFWMTALLIEVIFNFTWALWPAIGATTALNVVVLLLMKDVTKTLWGDIDHTDVAMKNIVLWILYGLSGVGIFVTVVGGELVGASLWGWWAAAAIGMLTVLRAILAYTAIVNLREYSQMNLDETRKRLDTNRRALAEQQDAPAKKRN